MKFTSTRRSDPVIDLTPMIDVVFQLLLFFMVTTTFIQASDDSRTSSQEDGQTPGIKVDLPESSNDRALGDNRDVKIWITAEGVMYLDETQVDLQGLRSALRGIAAQDKSRLIVIRADKGVAHGVVVGVMDAARQLGLTKIGISTETRPEP